MQSHSRSKAAPDASFAPLQAGLLQRKCACGQHTIAGGQCDECYKPQLSLQRATRNSEGVTRNSEFETANAGGVPPIVHQVLNSPGRPLDSATRAFFEPRFGHDFSRVRVHTDTKAAESAHAVNALAYTVGQHIVLGERSNIFNGWESRRTLAHELAHTIQQSGDVGYFGQRLEMSGQADQLESNAESASKLILEGAPTGSFRAANLKVMPRLARKAGPGVSEEPESPSLLPSSFTSFKGTVHFGAGEVISPTLVNAGLIERSNNSSVLNEASVYAAQNETKIVSLKGGAKNADFEEAKRVAIARVSAVWLELNVRSGGVLNQRYSKGKITKTVEPIGSSSVMMQNDRVDIKIMY